MKFDLQKPIHNEIGIIVFACLIVAMSFLLFAYTREQNEELKQKVEINENLKEAYKKRSLRLSSELVEKEIIIDSLNKNKKRKWLR
jgi:hypothetical protein